MGLNKFYSAIDYMLGTISLANYLLFSTYYSAFGLCFGIGRGKVINKKNYLRNFLDASVSFNLLFNGQINNYAAINLNNTDIQSAENYIGFSETIRQLFNSEEKFYHWLAGIIDRDGNIDIRKSTESLARKPILKSIRIKLHNRDVRILTRIQNYLHFGTVITFKNKPFSIYSVYKNEDKIFLINKLNGLIRIKSDSLKKLVLYIILSILNLIIIYQRMILIFQA